MEITFLQCESGRWLAWYNQRDDILANGETKEEVVTNLEMLYASVIEYERKEAISQ